MVEKSRNCILDKEYSFEQKLEECILLSER